MQVGIEGHQKLVRDTRNFAVLTNDAMGKQNYLQRKQAAIEQSAKVSSIIDDVNKLKDDVNIVKSDLKDIKDILLGIVNRENK